MARAGNGKKEESEEEKRVSKRVDTVDGNDINQAKNALEELKETSSSYTINDSLDNIHKIYNILNTVKTDEKEKILDIVAKIDTENSDDYQVVFNTTIAYHKKKIDKVLELFYDGYKAEKEVSLVMLWAIFRVAYSFQTAKLLFQQKSKANSLQ